jgi:hypothetical protein
MLKLHFHLLTLRFHFRLLVLDCVCQLGHDVVLLWCIAEDGRPWGRVGVKALVATEAKVGVLTVGIGGGCGLGSGAGPLESDWQLGWRICSILLVENL